MPTESDRHERTDVSVRGVFLAAGALAAAGIVVQLVVGVQFAALRGARESPSAPLAGARLGGPPEPRLQTMPAEDLAQLRAREDTILGGYGWEGRAASVGQMPIARAIGLVAREAAK